MWFIISTSCPDIFFSVAEKLVFLVFLSIMATIHCKELPISRLICGPFKRHFAVTIYDWSWVWEGRVKGWSPVPTFPSWFEIFKRKFHTVRPTPGFTNQNTFWCSYLPSFGDKQTFCVTQLTFGLHIKDLCLMYSFQMSIFPFSVQVLFPTPKLIYNNKKVVHRQINQKKNQ